MTEPLLQLQEVNLSHGQQSILQQVSLEVFPGQVLTLIGPNGAGKTTLVRIVLGLIPFNGKRICKAGLRMGYMPQKLELNPQLPIQVQRFLQLSGARLPEIKKRAGQVGIGNILNYPMQFISGGELQRVLLARALLRQPELLVLDEPAQGVDMHGQSDLYALINQVREEQGCGVLMVSHDLHWVMAQTNQVICLNQHICCHGHPDQISHDPSFIEIFGRDVSKNLAPYIHHHDHEHDLQGNIRHECKQEHTP